MKELQTYIAVRALRSQNMRDICLAAGLPMNGREMSHFFGHNEISDLEAYLCDDACANLGAIACNR